MTRRGAIRATLKGQPDSLDRAVAVHLDTLGAMVSQLKPNGRLAIAPIGSWSSRFAEGGRVTVFAEGKPYRGTVLPLKASGHRYGEGVDTQPVHWDGVEVRVDERCGSRADLVRAGFDVGDMVAFDAVPEFCNGFVNARHLDNKAGVALILTLLEEMQANHIEPSADCHILFTIAEEVGVGASSVLYPDVAEMVAIDLAPLAPEQNSAEFGVTIGMMDQSGPFDYHLSRKLARLCREHGIAYARDLFRFYRTDSASAIEAGNDTRTALVCFGADGSHGHERAHLDSLVAVGRLMGVYLQSAPTFKRDKAHLSSLNGFPHQPERDIIRIKT